MSRHQISGRQLKKKIRKLLLQQDFESAVAEICRLPARKVINPLFSFLCSLDELLKWRTVTTMGQVVDTLAAEGLESARVIMRRCMWQLNDESGGIGWGCPEAMGEIMARNQILAEEFGCILISYLQPHGNYLEHEALQRGVLWAVGRLAHARPEILKESGGCLQPFLRADDPFLRGLAAWSAAVLAHQDTVVLLEGLIEDTTSLTIFINGKLEKYTVGTLAQKALAAGKIEGRPYFDI